MTERKVWEETWFPGDCLVHSSDGNVALTAIDLKTGPRLEWPSNNELDRAQANAELIAAAPEMARLILKLEWSSSDIYGLYNACPVCSGVEPADYAEYPRDDEELGREKPPLGHEEKCEWVAVMQKAGVIK